MRTLAVLLEKEFRQFFRNPFLPRMALMFPMMVMLVMPWVTTMDIRHVSVSVVDCDRSPASRRIVQKIGASDYFTLCGVSDDFSAALRSLEAGNTDAVLEIPRDFGRSLEEDAPRRVSISANGVNATKGTLGMQYLVRTVAASVAELRGERVLRETLFAPQRGDRRSDNVLFHCMNLQKAFYPDEPRIGAPG